MIGAGANSGDISGILTELYGLNKLFYSRNMTLPVVTEIVRRASEFQV
jgi:hypothetical protein